MLWADSKEAWVLILGFCHYPCLVVIPRFYFSVFNHLVPIPNKPYMLFLRSYLFVFFSSFASLRQFSLFDFIVLHQIIYLDLCIKDKANGWLLLLLCIQCLFPLCLVFLMKITAMVIVASVVYDFTYPKTEKGISHEI